MSVGKRRPTLVGRRPLFWRVHADIEHHRRHAGSGKFGEILSRGVRRCPAQLLAKRYFQCLLGRRDHGGIVDDRFNTLDDLDLRWRRIRHGGDRSGGTSIPSCILARTSGLKVLMVPSRTASSGMMLPAVPAWSEPMETTPNSVGSFSRLMTLCTSTTKRDAIITGSMVACGAAPWPPRPLN